MALHLRGVGGVGLDMGTQQSGWGTEGIAA